MFAKGVTTIASIGIVACVLLVTRQQRVHAAYELAATVERTVTHERMQAQLRGELARRTAPAAVETLVKEMQADGMGTRAARLTDGSSFAWEDPAPDDTRSDEDDAPDDQTD